jgi:hypothetical protein
VSLDDADRWEAEQFRLEQQTEMQARAFDVWLHKVEKSDRMHRDCDYQTLSAPPANRLVLIPSMDEGMREGDDVWTALRRDGVDARGVG